MSEGGREVGRLSESIILSAYAIMVKRASNCRL